MGEEVVFDASDSYHTSDDNLIFFWTSPDFDDFYNEGPSHQRIFENEGNHAMEVWITTSGNTFSTSETSIGRAPDMSSSIHESTRETILVEVDELVGEAIDLTTPELNIHLTGDRQSVSVDEQAQLTFSASNLIGGDDLIVQLIMQIPQGLIVNNSTFSEDGGQFTSTYELESGETVNDRLRIEAIEKGSYLIGAHAVYFFEGDDQNLTEEDEIELRFFE